jgi:hypothetical protein
MIICVSLLVIPSAHAWHNGGWHWRKSDDLQFLSKYINGALEKRTERISCLMNPKCHTSGSEKRFLVVGDSYGEDTLIVLASAYPEYSFTAMTGSGCRPVKDWVLTNTKKKADCEPYYDRLFSADMSSYDGVVLSMIWQDLVFDKLGPTLEHFAAQGARKILVVGPKVRSANVAQLIAQSDSVEMFEQASREGEKIAAKERYEAMLKPIVQRYGAEYVDLAEAQCPEGQCVYILPGTLLPMFSDGSHYSEVGAEFVGKQMRNLHDEL